VAAPGGWPQGSALDDVRPYTITAGRTRPSRPLRLTSCVLTQSSPAGLSPESETILLLCTGDAKSIAEIAAMLRVPVQVAKVLVSDLLASHALALSHPAPSSMQANSPELLEAVLEGLHALPV
jgi:Protein of unknown function (DUF742)